MEKISYENAKKILTTGIPVKALVSRNYESVKSLSKLEELNRLDKMGVLKYELYYEPADTIIPKNGYDLNLDEAVSLIIDGEAIFSMFHGKEISFSSAEDIISYYQKCSLSGDPGLLYWYVG